MKNKGWIVVALAAAGLGVGIKGGCLSGATKAPDEKLAARFDELCVIARENISTPVKGVKKFGGYFAKHTGDLYADFGNTLAAIETITDDAKHDARARLARDRMRKPLILCARDWARFGDAVQSNEEASELLEDFNTRFSRTIEILFGEGQQLDQLDLLNLPAKLQKL